MKAQMITPDFFQPVVKETTKIIKKKPTKQDEDLLLEFSESDAWSKLRSMIEGKIALLGQDLRKAADKATNQEELGFRFAIFDQATKAYQSVIDMVELRRKVKAIQDNVVAEQEGTVS